MSRIFKNYDNIWTIGHLMHQGCFQMKNCTTFLKEKPLKAL